MTNEELIKILDDRLDGVIGLYGPHGCGKSFFGLLSPYKPILVLDNHGSVDQYQKTSGLDFQVKPTDINSLIDTVKEVKYMVSQNNIIVPDRKFGTIILESSELFTDYLYTQGSQHFSAAQVEKASGLVWGKAKSLLLHCILHLKSVTKVLIITSHTRTRYIAGVPTDDVESKFLEPIWDTSHLVVRMERNNSLLPTGLIDCKYGKTRHVQVTDGLATPVFPPRIENFTWQQLAMYLQNPVDYSNLTPQEMTPSSTGLVMQLSRIAENALKQENNNVGL